MISIDLLSTLPTFSLSPKERCVTLPVRKSVGRKTNSSVEGINIKFTN